ncbi:hypothetical protein C8Q73DRAFT_668432 [Cubamyces lactineus]|nr:hypothetical protein C8Q73DRAFT_668432 [Cubamyces lactineus]
MSGIASDSAYLTACCEDEGRKITCGDCHHQRKLSMRRADVAFARLFEVNADNRSDQDVAGVHAKDEVTNLAKDYLCFQQFVMLWGSKKFQTQRCYVLRVSHSVPSWRNVDISTGYPCSTRLCIHAQPADVRPYAPMHLFSLYTLSSVWSADNCQGGRATSNLAWFFSGMALGRHEKLRRSSTAPFNDGSSLTGSKPSWVGIPHISWTYALPVPKLQIRAISEQV